MILFELYKGLILESVNAQNVYNAIDNNYRIRIYYQGDKENAPGWRYVDCYAYGMSKASNPVVRCYQAFGKTTTELGNWKLFRLDRILQWQPTRYHYGNRPISDIDRSIPPFNPNGDRSMASVYKVKQFNVNPDNNTEENEPVPQEAVPAF